MAKDTQELYRMLLALLSEEERRTSAEVIETFTAQYPSEWQELVDKYGHRDDIPAAGGARRPYYAASTYLADRLVYMHRRGWVERGYTDDFDRAKWKHNKRMGTWKRLVPANEPIQPESTRAFTVRLPDVIYDRLSRDANVKKQSLGARAAEIITQAIQT